MGIFIAYFYRLGGRDVILLALVALIIEVLMWKSKGLLSLIFFVTLGGLLIICWKTDTTAGAVPLALTIAYIGSAYNEIVKLLRNRRMKP